jgi:hypothetical protein
MGNFRFYNGASVGDVRLALGRGCGRTGLRGDFDVLQRLGAGYGDGYLYGRGSGGGRPRLDRRRTAGDRHRRSDPVARVITCLW